MNFVADVHLHSHFSRATSKQLNLEHLHKWAQLKGVRVVGTGDIAHPGWLSEMKNKLEPAEAGLFRLKDEFARAMDQEVFKACRAPVRFMLAGEISNIYKKNDKVRKIHNVVFMPSFDAVQRLQAELEKIGNIRSDGRPILGLDSRDLFEIVLETDPEAYLIPAHIWTPWFALLGSMSGFDSVEECFDDLTPEIFALETGLSSDPPMNWRLSALDRYTLFSNSDAHSPQKLGREANLFQTELSYPAIFEALKTGDSERFRGTIEFFPEEGKYHYDGHRKCGVRWDPKATLANDSVCPHCGRKVTVGVMHRVEELADREPEDVLSGQIPYKSLIPLTEVLAEIYGVGAGSKKVAHSFELILSKLGSELDVLMHVPLEDLEKLGGSLLSEGVRRMRAGEIHIAAGYDGEYGTIKMFEAEERKEFSLQLGFFEKKAKPKKLKDGPKVSEIDRPKKKNRAGENGNLPQLPALLSPGADAEPGNGKQGNRIPKIDIAFLLAGLNDQQKDAVETLDRPLIIVAGPGTGKTRTLTDRIAYLIHEKDFAPQNVLAVTFTNKAAEEMVLRLSLHLDKDVVRDMSILTFHALGLEILQTHGYLIGLVGSFSVIDQSDKVKLLRTCLPSGSDRQLNDLGEQIALAKSLLLDPDSPMGFERFAQPGLLQTSLEKYQKALRVRQVLDFEDLIYLPVRLFDESPAACQQWRRRFQWISVDEYQDVNFAQYSLLRKLISPETNLCVIGDPEQSIYGFRGSSSEFFDKFRGDFPNARVINLTRNYRSSQVILGASENVISKDRRAARPPLLAEIVSDRKVEIWNCLTEHAEAEQIVHEIEKMVGGTSYFSIDSGRVSGEETSRRAFGDIAVLFRLMALSRPLRAAFDRSGIPYQIVGEKSIFETQFIKDILSFLWFLSEPDCDRHLARVLLLSAPGLGERSVAKIATHAERKSSSIWQIVQNEVECLSFGHKIGAALRATVSKLRDLQTVAGEKTLSELIEHIACNLFLSNSEKDQQLRLQIDRLIVKSRPFDDDFDAFLAATTLHRESDHYDDKADKVVLMTLHAAKGLEFPVVFIAGCEDGLLPYTMAHGKFDLAEERRLMYVGMTRAEERLILTRAKNRFLFGSRMRSDPSPFIEDIESHLKEIQQNAYRINRPKQIIDDQISLF